MIRRFQCCYNAYYYSVMWLHSMPATIPRITFYFRFLCIVMRQLPNMVNHCEERAISEMWGDPPLSSSSSSSRYYSNILIFHASTTINGLRRPLVHTVFMASDQPSHLDICEWWKKSSEHRVKASGFPPFFIHVNGQLQLNILITPHKTWCVTYTGVINLS